MAETADITTPEERLTHALNHMGKLLDRRGAELVAARAERDAFKAELAEARAAIERVKKAAASFEWTTVGKLVLAALDAPRRPEGIRERPKFITGNGVKRLPSEETTAIYEDAQDGGE